jgi:uracil-DNA glycosylase
MVEAMRESGEGAGMSRAEAASLLGWWLEAGVDTAIADEPRNWLAPPRVPLAEAEERLEAGPPHSFRQSVAPAGVPQPPLADLPRSLEDYHAWLRTGSDLPLFRAGAARALPHGPAGARLMLLTGFPALEDAAEGRPIGGEALALATRMLAAIGLTLEETYVAGLSCFAAAGARMSDREKEACREAMLRHIELASPERLLLLGDAPARLLLDQTLVQARGRVHRVGGRPAVVTFTPAHLLKRPGDKPLAWRDLLLLTGENN